MNRDLLILLFFNVLAVAGLGFFFISRLRQLKLEGNPDEEDAKMKRLVNEVFGEVTGKVSEQSQRVLATERELIATDLKNKHAQIEKTVEELRKELQERQRELRVMEGERSKQLTDLTTHIREHQQITRELSENTVKLKSVLSNNQQRGQWGEHILDDILQTAGLVENTHYRKQASLTATEKPDITLLLPNQRFVAVDAKFPYSAVMKMADAETNEGKQLARKEFLQDVKTKISKVEKYINPEAGTLDYALLFVPNEMLFSFINQTAPEVMEMAMKKRVLIVSPFTFMIVARTILESYRNFMMENHLRDIIKHIGNFTQEWIRFEDEFGKFDGQIEKLRDAYDQITTTRYKQMRLRMRKVEEFQQGVLEQTKPEAISSNQDSNLLT